MSRDHVLGRWRVLGVTFMITGAVTDTIYAVLAGRARRFFSARRTRTLVADLRRLHDRRRHLAGADTGALSAFFCSLAPLAGRGSGEGASQRVLTRGWALTRRFALTSPRKRGELKSSTK